MKKELNFPITIKTSITFNDRQELLNFIKDYEQDSHYEYPNEPKLYKWKFIEDIANNAKLKNNKSIFNEQEMLEELWNTIKTKFKKNICYFKVIGNRIEFNDDENDGEGCFYIYVDKTYKAFKLEYEYDTFGDSVVCDKISVIIDKIENTLRVQEYLK